MTEEESRRAFEAFMDDQDSSWRYSFSGYQEFLWKLWEAARTLMTEGE